MEWMRTLRSQNGKAGLELPGVPGAVPARGTKARGAAGAAGTNAQGGVNHGDRGGNDGAMGAETKKYLIGLAQKCRRNGGFE